MSTDPLFPDLFDAPRQPTPIARVVSEVMPGVVRPLQPEAGAPPSGAIPPRSSPWLRLGRSFEPTSDATEALKRSGLDWAVEKVGLRTADLSPIHNHVAIRRTDNARVLGIVGADFQPLQNAEAFAFFRDLAGEARISFETAGAFDGGSITWVQARLPDLGIRIGDDVSDSYLFISNGHIGNKTLTIAPTTIRIVCRNTLRMAEAQLQDARQRRHNLETGFSVRHSRGMKEALADIQDAYARTVRSHAATSQAYDPPPVLWTPR